MDKKDYLEIIQNAKDDCLWDFPHDEIDYLIETEKIYGERCFASIEGRLYELPDDYKED